MFLGHEPELIRVVEGLDTFPEESGALSSERSQSLRPERPPLFRPRGHAIARIFPGVSVWESAQETKQPASKARADLSIPSARTFAESIVRISAFACGRATSVCAFLTMELVTSVVEGTLSSYSRRRRCRGLGVWISLGTVLKRGVRRIGGLQHLKKECLQ